MKFVMTDVVGYFMGYDAGSFAGPWETNGTVVGMFEVNAPRKEPT